MDNAKKKIPMIVSLILIFIALAAQLYLIISNFSAAAEATIIQELIIAIALMAAFMYVYTEYKKSSSEYFRLFIVSYAVVLLAFLLETIATAPVAVIIISVLAIVLLIVLLVTKNLGKKNSVIISLAILLLELAISITMYLAGMLEGQQSVILVLLPRLTLPVVLLIMLFLKYKDKQMRGTK